jgi:hypothetical protein
MKAIISIAANRAFPTLVFVALAAVWFRTVAPGFGETAVEKPPTQSQSEPAKLGAVKQGTATVRAVRGRADFLNPKGKWEELRLGKVLHAGDRVRTSDVSEVDFFLGQNGPVIRLSPGSLLSFDELSLRESAGEILVTTRLNLERGRILGNFKRFAVGSICEIKTSKGIIHPTDRFEITSP